jgi:hypothetical protein
MKMQLEADSALSKQINELIKALHALTAAVKAK